MKIATIKFVFRPWHFVPFFVGLFVMMLFSRMISFIARMMSNGKNIYLMREKVFVRLEWKRIPHRIKYVQNNNRYEIDAPSMCMKSQNYDCCAIYWNERDALRITQRIKKSLGCFIFRKVYTNINYTEKYFLLN